MKITKTNLRKLVREASDPFGLGGAGAFRKYGDDVRWLPEAAAPKRARKPRGVGAEQGFKRLMKLAKEMGEDWLEDNPIDGGEDSYSLYDVAHDLGMNALHNADPKDLDAALRHVSKGTAPWYDELNAGTSEVKHMLISHLGDAAAGAQPRKRRSNRKRPLPKLHDPYQTFKTH